MMYGPQAALIAEAFTPRLRYSGSSLGYQFASIIAGGPAPLIATALFAAYHTASRASPTGSAATPRVPMGIREAKAADCGAALR
jgi:hypothetical protein